MSIWIFFVGGLAMTADTAPAPEPRAVATVPLALQSVPGSRLRDAAIARVRELATSSGIVLDFAGTDVPRDLRLAAPLTSLDAMAPSAWLRPRVPVTVRARDAAGRTTTATVWLRLTAPSMAPVYSRGFASGARISAGDVVDGRVDLARTHAAPVATDATFAATRLRRAVRAGEPVLAADFEPMPDVLAQQAVRIESGRGAFRLSARGVALRDGRLGDWIDVRWSGADRPMRARVTSNEVVTLEE